MTKRKTLGFAAFIGLILLITVKNVQAVDSLFEVALANSQLESITIKNFFDKDESNYTVMEVQNTFPFGNLFDLLEMLYDRRMAIFLLKVSDPEFERRLRECPSFEKFYEINEFRIKQVDEGIRKKKFTYTLKVAYDPLNRSRLVRLHEFSWMDSTGIWVTPRFDEAQTFTDVIWAVYPMMDPNSAFLKSYKSAHLIPIFK